MTDAPEKVEGITSVQRRRRWNAAEKIRMAEENLEPGASVSLVARTIGIARARVKTGLANLAYNMKRLVWLSGRPAPA